MIGGATDNQLELLHHYLTGSDPTSFNHLSPFSSAGLRLFLSHVSGERELVGEVGRQLELIGIDSFVAHDSIEPSEAWQDVIEAGLTDCDSLIAFVHPGFASSKWCDQEVGWVLGRKVPILALTFGSSPHGFLAKYQAKDCSTQEADRIATTIQDWLISQRTLQTRLAESFTHAFVESRSFHRTRMMSGLLSKIASYTDDQLSRLEASVERNNNVGDVYIGNLNGPKWVASFVNSQRGEVEPN